MSRKMARKALFKLSLELFKTLECSLSVLVRQLLFVLRCITFQTFLFQKLPNMGGIWDQGQKKVIPPPENPTDRLD